jgi:hypothetical protein
MPNKENVEGFTITLYISRKSLMFLLPGAATSARTHEPGELTLLGKSVINDSNKKYRGVIAGTRRTLIQRRRGEMAHEST